MTSLDISAHHAKSLVLIPVEPISRVRQRDQAGSLEHFYQGETEGGADILLAASAFHFRKFSIGQVKNFLKGRGIPVLGV